MVVTVRFGMDVRPTHMIFYGSFGIGKPPTHGTKSMGCWHSLGGTTCRNLSETLHPEFGGFDGNSCYEREVATM